MKQYISQSIILFITLTFSFSAKSQVALTLNEAIIIGLENNFEIQIGQMNRDVARIQNSWGNAGLWPSISLQAGMNNSLTNREETSIQNGYFSGAVQANWVLFDGFAVKIRKSRLEYLERISGGNAAVIVENTIQAIILGYNKTLLEIERLNVLQTVMKLSQDRYDYVQHKADLGAGSTYEVSQAKGDWLTDKTNFLSQQMSVKSANRQLAYLLALPPETDLTLTDILQPAVAEYQLAGLKDKMEVENQTLQNQYLNLSLLDKAVALANSNRLPTIALNTGIQSAYYPDALNSNDNISQQGDSYSFYANLSLNYTIFNGNQVNRDIEIAKIQTAIGNVQLAEIKSRLTNQLFDYYELYNVRKELYALQTENLETAKINMDISTEKYRNGAISSFDFRNTQRTYLETAIRQIQSAYNLIETNTNIIRITGGIIAEYGD